MVFGSDEMMSGAGGGCFVDEIKLWDGKVCMWIQYETPSRTSYLFIEPSIQLTLNKWQANATAGKWVNTKPHVPTLQRLEKLLRRESTNEERNEKFTSRFQQFIFFSLMVFVHGLVRWRWWRQSIDWQIHGRTQSDTLVDRVNSKRRRSPNVKCVQLNFNSIRMSAQLSLLIRFICASAHHAIDVITAAQRKSALWGEKRKSNRIPRAPHTFSWVKRIVGG